MVSTLEKRNEKTNTHTTYILNGVCEKPGMAADFCSRRNRI